MKKIEDYCHLYLGCNFVLKIRDTENLSGVMYFGLPALHASLTEREDDKISPILLLRPLDTMTEEESKEFQDTKVFVKATPVHMVGPHLWKEGQQVPDNEIELREGKTYCFDVGRQAYGCDECCNGDRCDDPSHVDRKNCTWCDGKGWLKEKKVKAFYKKAATTVKEEEKREDSLVDDIVGVLYANKTDEADEGSWIESKDFHKAASAIVKLLTTTNKT